MDVGTGKQQLLDGAGESTATAERCALTVVIPTRNEAAVLPGLFERLAGSLDGLSAEVLFVDDSDDDTPERLADFGSEPESEFAVRVLHRDPSRRRGGLGTAVVEGLLAARSPWVCVMDADLQHPPELIRPLYARSDRDGANLVIASRYCDDGASDLSSGRHAVSRLSTRVARALFPRRLRSVTDPMSGFFIVNRDEVPIGALRPNGFKILLEILVRSPELTVVEVPFHLAQRHAGRSKGSLAEGLRFGSHLLRLRLATFRRSRAGLVSP
jgi:glycosyltransferase involved in cell wall biosynthesis